MFSQPIIEIVPRTGNCTSQNFSPFLLNLPLFAQAALLPLDLPGHPKHLLNFSFFSGREKKKAPFCLHLPGPVQFFINPFPIYQLCHFIFLSTQKQAFDPLNLLLCTVIYLFINDSPFHLFRS